MNKKYKVTIFLEGTYREYSLDASDLVNKDWSEEMGDMFSSYCNEVDI